MLSLCIIVPDMFILQDGLFVEPRIIQIVRPTVLLNAWASSSSSCSAVVVVVVASAVVVAVASAVVVVVVAALVLDNIFEASLEQCGHSSWT